MKPATKRAERVSVSLDAPALARAKRVAKRRGVALSRLVADALAQIVEEEERRAAADEFIATFPPHARVTDKELEAYRKQWSTPYVPPHAAGSKKRRAVG